MQGKGRAIEWDESVKTIWFDLFFPSVLSASSAFKNSSREFESES
jgi:hypothetical protein